MENVVGVIVVFPRAEDAKNIRNIIVRSGFPVSAVCTSGSQALNMADRLADGIVVCGYKFSDMLYTQLKEDLPNGFEMLLIASEGVIRTYREDDTAYLALPLKKQDLADCLEILTQNILIRRKKARMKPRVRSQKEIDLIARAKEMLMRQSHMTEEEAHHYMQKCSMDSGTNLAEAAQMLLMLKGG